MANAIDFLIEDDGDLVENPVTLDWEEGNSDGQHIQDILQLEPGELKYDILMGVGITRAINGPAADGQLRRIIQMQLEADDYSIKKLTVTNETIEIDAERNS